ncbi:MAG: hypothetical protein M3Y22_07585 [Pseudomonadota bacterium]|nr:hypothetical protein [Pseudomonadota bacterium]
MKLPRILSGLATVAVLVCGTAHAGSVFQVSQSGRMFHPDVLEIGVGDTVHVVNDDGELIHHAYVHSPSFTFDSGEEAPSSKLDIVFPVAGRFEVRCVIHPKMRLIVTVR